MLARFVKASNVSSVCRSGTAFPARVDLAIKPPTIELSRDHQLRSTCNTKRMNQHAMRQTSRDKECKEVESQRSEKHIQHKLQFISSPLLSASTDLVSVVHATIVVQYLQG